MNHSEINNKKKKLVYSCQYIEKWSEMKLLKYDFVSSAAWRCRVFVNYSELTNHRALKALFISVVYINT